MNHLPFTLSTLESELWQPIAEDFCGKKYQKIALVVQGGGQRGIFTAGVLDAFLEANFDPFTSANNALWIWTGHWILLRPMVQWHWIFPKHKKH
ncbi:hypothetical protein [Photobacterium damselae]|uniref:hypothetical protein n=1 Tax=Photobacterium damselae TaxID=38293 RepID=UPI002F3EB098